MTAATLTDTSRAVYATLHDLQRATAEQLAATMELDLCDVYGALVQLHDNERAVMLNAHHHYRRGTGRACLWSPA